VTGFAIMQAGKRLVTAALAVLALASCQNVQTTQPGLVGVDRQQSMLVSQRQVDGMAQDQYGATLNEARKKGQLNRNPEQVQRVRMIMQRMIAHAALFRSDATRWSWEANVITSDQLNAWCMPGGKIAVYSGLIERLKLSDDELAAVMGHEISHALREHARERISKEVGANLLISILGAATGTDTRAAAQGYQLLVGLPNSREMETEADRIGIELMARAGYDPRAAVSVWQKMQAAANGGPPQFLSTHPSYSTRINDLTQYAQRVMPLYEQAKGSKP
jgi:predicted Zn-dependent protease